MKMSDSQPLNSGRIAALSVQALCCIFLLAGCVQNPTGRTYASSSGLSQFAATLTNATSSCSSQPNPKPGEVEIKVFFREFDPGQWCPYAVDDDCVLVFEDKFITWKAYKEDGTEFPPGLGPKFELVFDPIQGAPLPAPNGEIKKKVDSDAPRVTYKYTVWRKAVDNDGKVCDPLDPNIRIY